MQGFLDRFSPAQRGGMFLMALLAVAGAVMFLMALISSAPWLQQR